MKRNTFFKALAGLFTATVLPIEGKSKVPVSENSKEHTLTLYTGRGGFKPPAPIRGYRVSNIARPHYAQDGGPVHNCHEIGIRNGQAIDRHQLLRTKDAECTVYVVGRSVIARGTDGYRMDYFCVRYVMSGRELVEGDELFIMCSALPLDEGDKPGLGGEEFKTRFDDGWYGGPKP